MGKKNISEEECLLLKKKEDEDFIARKAASEGDGDAENIVRWRVVMAEMKSVGVIAAPMVAVVLSQFLLQVISTMMVGHLGELSLSSSAIALSFAAVTGFSFMQGLASGLETLCGQAYGAQQYHRLGTQTFTAMFALFLVCIPLSLVWINMGKLLILLGQDVLIAHEAGRFLVSLVPALFASAALQPLVRYFQSQSMIMPMLLSSCTTLCVHVPLCWALVFKSPLANLGAAVAIDVSLWLNVMFLSLYMRFSPACEKTRVASFSMEIFSGLGEFFRFAVPSAVMICLEWWSFEMLILFSGLLPNPELETSVLSICLSTGSTLYAIPCGLAAAASTRVSNELGANNSQGARVAFHAAILIAVAEGITMSLTLFGLRHVYGYSYSNEEEVVNYVSQILPWLCLSVFIDSQTAVLTGVARGCGWQHIGAFLNLGAYYLFGIPIAVILGFWLQLRGKGLWLGILSGSCMQAVMFFIVIARIDWEKQAIDARLRIFEGRHVHEKGVIDERRLLAN